MLNWIATIACKPHAKPRGAMFLVVPLICLASLLGGCAGASEKPNAARTEPAAGAVEFNMDTAPSSPAEMEKQLNQIQKDSVSTK